MPTTQKKIRKLTGKVNDVLLDKAVRHAHYLERFKTGEVNKIVGLLNADVLPDALTQIERRLEKIKARGFDTSTYNTNRLKQLSQATEGIISGGIEYVGDELRKDLEEFALSESVWQAKTLKESVPFSYDFTTPNVQTLHSIVTATPYQGKVLKDWFDGVAASTQDKIVQQINIGIAQGQSVPDIVSRLRGTAANNFSDGVMQGTRQQVAAVARTSINHVSTHAREATYEANSDVVDKIQIVATLDTRTTEICMGMDGKTFPLNSGPRPPFHFGCRTTTVPITKSWDELGIKGLKEPPPSTRASMDGQVPDKLTYGDWLKQQTPAVQDEALGPARAQLFRDGKVSIEQFTDDKGKQLSLEQLKAVAGTDQFIDKGQVVGNFAPTPTVPPAPVVPPPVVPATTPSVSKIEGLTSGSWDSSKVKTDIDTGYPKASELPKPVVKMIDQLEALPDVKMPSGNIYKANPLPQVDVSLTADQKRIIAEAKKVTNVTLDPATLVSKQNWIDQHRLVRMTGNNTTGEAIKAVKLTDGRIMVIDGNHRAVLGIMEGKSVDVQLVQGVGDITSADSLIKPSVPVPPPPTPTVEDNVKHLVEEHSKVAIGKDNGDRLVTVYDATTGAKQAEKLYPNYATNGVNGQHLVDPTALADKELGFMTSTAGDALDGMTEQHFAVLADQRFVEARGVTADAQFVLTKRDNSKTYAVDEMNLFRNKVEKSLTARKEYKTAISQFTDKADVSRIKNHWVNSLTAEKYGLEYKVVADYADMYWPGSPVKLADLLYAPKQTAEEVLAEIEAALDATGKVDITKAVAIKRQEMYDLLAKAGKQSYEGMPPDHPLYPKFNEVLKEYWSLKDQQKAVKNEKEIVWEVLAKQVKEGGQGMKMYVGGAGGKVRDKTIKAQEWLEKHVSSRNTSSLPVTVHKISGRAYQSNKAIYLTEWDEVKVFVHELGHAIEEESREALQASQRFLNRRTVGEQPSKLKDLFPNLAYKQDEIAKEDKFLEPYMGKLYGYAKNSGNKSGEWNVHATEIGSMGLEMMYSDPVRLLKRDPDMFKFLVDWMRGNWDAIQ